MKRAFIFLNDGDCWAYVYTPSESFFRDGITERNVMELVRLIRDELDYHVTLYRVSAPQFFSPAQKGEM